MSDEIEEEISDLPQEELKNTPLEILASLLGISIYKEDKDKDEMGKNE